MPLKTKQKLTFWNAYCIGSDEIDVDEEDDDDDYFAVVPKEDVV